jgi:hypothetical protein
VINNTKNKDELSYKKIIEMLNDENNINKHIDNNEMILFNKPRLAIFESIIKNVNNTHSTLKEDIKSILNDLLNENNYISYKSNYVMNNIINENDIEHILSKEEEEKFCRMLNL